MKNKKFITLAALSGITALGVILVAEKMETTTSAPKAVDCLHSQVEHYSGTIDGENSQVEHWACCKCHTAWADEARTIEIGNTVSDRSKIDVSVDCRYVADWNEAKSQLIYDETDGYKFRNYITNLDDGASCAIETNNSAFTLDASKRQYAYAFVTNKTSQIIRADVHRRDWSNRVYSDYIAPNETKGFLVMAEDWNGAKSGDNYGFALLCYNTAAQTAGGYIDVTKLQYGEHLISYVQDSSFKMVNPSYDSTDGPIYTADLSTAGGIVRLINRKVTDESLYDGVSFDVYNNTGSDITNRNIWSEGWEGHVTGTGLLKNGEWTTVFVSNYVWNYNSGVSIYDLPSSGTLLIKNFKLVEKVEKPTRVITFGDGGITLQSENMAGNDWPSCSKSQIDDPTVGVAYKYNATEFNNDIKNNTLYWVLNKEQLDAVLDGDGSEMDIFVPDNGKTYRFGVQDTTSWAQVEKPLANGVWNHIVVDNDFVKNLNFAVSGNVAYFRLLASNPEDFYTDDFMMTPMYKHERVLTDVTFGSIVATGSTLENFGKTYNLTRGAFYVDNAILDTFGNFNKDTLRILLPEKTTKLVFAIYNPLDEDVTFFTAGGKPWANGNTTNLVAKSWTTVIFNEADFALTDTGVMYIYARKSGGVGAADASGWMITDIWAI